jgi:DNA-binding MarR family transcriptional regulator
MARAKPIGGHQFLHLKLIEQVEQSPELTHRQAARILGVSIKLGHTLVTTLIEKGYFHVVKVNSRRWHYFLTPHGVAEKSRLTREFLEFSLHFYREARKRSAQLCRDLAEAGVRQVAFVGAGDLAEIAYLGVQEWGLTLVAVYDAKAGGTFMRVPVSPLNELRQQAAETIIVCLYDRGTPMSQQYLPRGVTPLPNMRWIFAPPAPAKPPPGVPIL